MSTFTFNFYLDTRTKLKSGLHNIRVNLFDQKEKESLALTIKKVDGQEVSASPDDWDKIWTNRHRKNEFGEIVGETTVYGRRLLIRTILKEKHDILSEIIERENVLDNNDVKKAFYNYEEPQRFIDDVYLGFEEKIKELKDNDQYKTVKVYETTLQAIYQHNSGTGFRYSDVTLEWLRKFEKKRRQGVSVNSLSIDMRNLRHIVKRAAEQSPILFRIYPFGAGKNKYSIPSGSGKNVSVSAEDIQKIIDLETNDLYMQMGRDYWIFSYFNRGMNLKDIALLKKGQTEFIRSKTEFTAKKIVPIKLTSNKILDEIVARHSGTGKYLFDIIDDHDDAATVQNKIGKKISSINRQIKKMAKVLEIDPGLSFVWGRHSYTTNVHKAGVDIKAISETLGHTSLKTTENYIDSLQDENQSKIDEALGIYQQGEKDKNR